MNTFEDRKKGYEAKYQKDQEAEFKIRSKRNRILGQSAADQIKPNDIDTYVKEVRLSDLEKPGDDDIIDKILGDFETNSIPLTRQDIVQKIQECYNQAVKEYYSETSS